MDAENPYQSPTPFQPQAAPIEEEPEVTRPEGRFVSAAPQADSANFWLGIGAFLTPVLAICDLVRMQASAPMGDRPDDLGAVGALVVGCIGLAVFGVMLIASILFAVWFYRATRNIMPLANPHPGFSPGMATLVLFLPLVNLYRPYIVLRELWLSSNPNSLRRGVNDSDYHDLRNYWTLFVASTLTPLVGAVVAALAGTITIMILANLLTYLLAVAATVQLIGLVREITGRQNRRYQLVMNEWPALRPGAKMADWVQPEIPPDPPAAPVPRPSAQDDLDLLLDSVQKEMSEDDGGGESSSA